MLDDLGWPLLKNRRTDACLIMLHSVIYNYVAIQVPPYFERPEVPTRHKHPLAFRHIHSRATYHQQSFYPATIVSNPSIQQLLYSGICLILTEVVLTSDLNSFKNRARVIYQLPGSPKNCFNQLLNSLNMY